MPPIQTTYPDHIRDAVAGAPGTMISSTDISRTVENVGGVAFGKAVAQGTQDYGCHAFTAGDTAVLGFAMRDRSLVAEGNSFPRYESARIRTEGDLWVQVAQNVVAGDPVYVRPSNGDIQKDNTNSAVAATGWRFDTSASSGELALIRRG